MKKLYRKIKDKIGGNYLFLCGVIVVFLIISLGNMELGLTVFQSFFSRLIAILPILLTVYVFIFLLQLLISNKKIITFLKKGTYFKKILLSSFLGVLSSGPIYMRYGFLKDLLKKGLSFGHLSTFSYARAIKIPLFPMMILYFGLKFTIIFTLVLFVLSFLNGILVDVIFKKLDTSK